MFPESNLQGIGEIPLCIAVDKSGSTWGTTLNQEIEAVQKICRLRSPRNDNPIKLLPW